MLQWCVCAPTRAVTSHSVFFLGFGIIFNASASRPRKILHLLALPRAAKGYAPLVLFSFNFRAILELKSYHQSKSRIWSKIICKNTFLLKKTSARSAGSFFFPSYKKINVHLKTRFEILFRFFVNNCFYYYY